MTSRTLDCCTSEGSPRQENPKELGAYQKTTAKKHAIVVYTMESPQRENTPTLLED